MSQYKFHLTKLYWTIFSLQSSFQILYVFTLPAGLPYDELSHLEVAEYYASNWRIPKLGIDINSYQAHQPPLYYVLSGFWLNIIPLEDSLIELRLLNVLLCLFLVITLKLIVDQVLSLPQSGSYESLLVLQVISTFPILLLISTSVNNDLLATLLVSICIYVYLRLNHKIEKGDFRTIALLGLLISTMLLTKLSTASIAFCLILYFVYQVKSLKLTLLFLAFVSLPTGSWLIWNLSQYQSLLASSRLDDLGYLFKPEAWNLATNFSYFHTLANYFFFPTEYLRNSLDAPVAFQLGAIFIGILLIILLLKVISHYFQVNRRLFYVENSRLISLSLLVVTTTFFYLYTLNFSIFLTSSRTLVVLLPFFAILLVSSLNIVQKRLSHLYLFSHLFFNIASVLFFLNNFSSLPELL